MRISDMPASLALTGEELIPIYDPNQVDPALQNRAVHSNIFQGVQGERGFPGLTAYQIWLNNGHTGTEADFLTFTIGPTGLNGTNGTNGASAFDLWVSSGHSGTESDFLASLIGKSSYQSWLSVGNTGSEADFVTALRGSQGYSAYQIWLQQGNTGSVQDFITAITGLSAYQIWLANGHTGTESDFLNAIKGPQGNQGAQGNPGPQGVVGPTGPSGSFWRSGNGVPSNALGVNGDFYINNTTSDIYGPKAGGVWGSPVINIHGSIWFSAAGVPSVGTGVNNDFYLNTTNGDVYKKASGSWGAPVGNIKGPQGIQGIQGIQGPQGPQGPQGDPAPAGFVTGDFKLSSRATASAGWVKANDGTIGNTGSGATCRANDDTVDLYTLYWNQFNDTICPVTGGRGPSALVDFTDGKPLSLLRLCGRVLGAAGTGRLEDMMPPLTARSNGSWTGEENHTLILSETPSHHHLVTVDDGTTRPALDDPGGTNIYIKVAGLDGSSDSEYLLNGSALTPTKGLTSSVGSDQAHNNMQPTAFVNLMIKL